MRNKQNESSSDTIFWSILILVFALGLLFNKNIEVTKDNYFEFREKYIGKSEMEIKEEFGTPTIYQPPKMGIVGGMSYNTSNSIIIYYTKGILGQGYNKGLYYKNKMDYEKPLTFVLNKKNIVVDVESGGLDTDEVKKPKLDVTQ